MSSSVHVVCPHCDAVNRVPESRLGEGAQCGKCHSPLFPGVPLVLDERRFAKHTGRSELPVVVDFWAPWCGPCQMMAPAFEEAARRLEPRARLVKVNTEEAPGLATELGIRSIPTLALFREGREVARTAGAMDAGRLMAWVQQHL
ncbi:MAG: thioredoxin TrxC [Pseudomonadota bacterium]|nr:thioredoxin TrxC [Pseudomonadota bacterium]